MGSGLHKVKKEKKLGGKGKLTDAVIDSMQTYYGKAIRENKGDVKKMQLATLAILYHKLFMDKSHSTSTAHPTYGANTGTEQEEHTPFKHQKPLPATVGQAILPLFQRSVKDSAEKVCGRLHTEPR